MVAGQVRAVMPPRAPTPAPLSTNITANLVGRVWAAGLQFAFVPIYLRYVGVEGYGLIGLFTSLLVLSNVFDLGLSSTINRELARTERSRLATREPRDRLRTFELTYLALAVFVGGLMVVAAPLVATGWLQQRQLPTGELTRVLMLMGLVLAAQWPVSLYSGALLGLQEQVRLNAINVAAVTVRTVGAALVLAFVSPSVTAFFAWQLAASAAHSLALRTSAWRRLAGGPRAHFVGAHLIAVWRFAAGVSIISILGVLFTQMDKLVLSRLLDLTAFGYYSLAAVVASGVSYLVLPVFEAAYPRFSHLLADDEPQELESTYHQVGQVMAVVVVPVVVMGALFAWPLVAAWTGSSETADQTATLVALLVVGTGLNGLANAPYALMLASGWTRLPLLVNLISAAILVPALFAAVWRFGAPGGAGTWLVLNLGYATVMVMVMHRRLLRGHARRWYVEDVGPAIVSTGLVALLLRSLVPMPAARIPSAATLLAIGLLVGVAGALATSSTRTWLVTLVRHRLRRPDSSAT